MQRGDTVSGEMADGESWSSQASKVDVTALSPAVIDGYNYTGVYTLGGQPRR